MPSTTTAARRARTRTPGVPTPWQMFFQRFLKHPVMVGSIVPSSDKLIRKMLGPVDWANCKLFVEYGPGVGTFCRPILERMAPDAQADRDRHQPRFHPLSAPYDRRSALLRGARLGGGRRARSSHDHGARSGRLRAVGPALLDPAARRRPGDRGGDPPGDPPRRRVPGLSVLARGEGLPRPAFHATSTTTWNGGTCRRRNCIGGGRRAKGRLRPPRCARSAHRSARAAGRPCRPRSTGALPPPSHPLGRAYPSPASG